MVPLFAALAAGDCLIMRDRCWPAFRKDLWRSFAPAASPAATTPGLRSAPILPLPRRDARGKSAGSSVSHQTLPSLGTALTQERAVIKRRQGNAVTAVEKMRDRTIKDWLVELIGRASGKLQNISYERGDRAAGGKDRGFSPGALFADNIRECSRRQRG